MKIEYWTAVVGFEGLYEVSSFGRIRSIGQGIGCKPNGGILTPRFNNDGYLQIHLRKNGKDYSLKIHRIVAQAFIPNPHNLPCVNHKDEDKTNNSVENLEWCDRSYNVNYGSRNSKVAIKLRKRVHQFEGDELVGIYDSASLAAKFLGLNGNTIKRTCQGHQKTYKGYRWTY